MTQPPYDPWADADGTPVPQGCRVEQVEVARAFGALASRLHRLGEVLGRGTTRLVVLFDGEHAPVSIRPHAVRVVKGCPYCGATTTVQRAPGTPRGADAWQCTLCETDWATTAVSPARPHLELRAAVRQRAALDALLVLAKQAGTLTDHQLRDRLGELAQHLAGGAW